MPHLVILYTPKLDAATDMGALCRTLADTMVAAKDESGQRVFPTGGVRVFAYPAAHSAVADGSGDFGFVYLNLRMARGRSPATQQALGRALDADLKRHFETLLATRPIGITLQIDEGAEVFDAKNSSLHPLFANKTAP